MHFLNFFFEKSISLLFFGKIKTEKILQHKYSLNWTRFCSKCIVHSNYIICDGVFQRVSLLPHIISVLKNGNSRETTAIKLSSPRPSPHRAEHSLETMHNSIFYCWSDDRLWFTHLSVGSFPLHGPLLHNLPLNASWATSMHTHEILTRLLHIKKCCVSFQIGTEILNIM
jgi:hypothetical protein